MEIRKYFLFFLFLFIINSIASDVILKVIEVSWTDAEDYREFIRRNISEEGTFTILPGRGTIILNDTSSRINFIESYIRKKDITKSKQRILYEKNPVKILVKVHDGEKLEVVKEVMEGKDQEFSNQHPVIYIPKGENEYKVEMVGLKVVLWFEKVSSMRAIARLDVFYDYLIGWNKQKEPIIDKQVRTIDFSTFLGDENIKNNINIGNRVIDVSLKLGYNHLEPLDISEDNTGG
ncbi:MAG: hypothetical protein C0601_02200 [Candidatus Muiribacterium halophilum]|uniref:Uncharacterized protein n=1 Tax=Muiribacterium halophilum TaxID=2053465 RepID=A0A2N5ZKY7_MUIH1|nr:MAG: hypothetical protein C0601_02200 [Candidatus Muirbacterium halophilum]